MLSGTMGQASPKISMFCRSGRFDGLTGLRSRSLLDYERVEGCTPSTRT